MAKTRSAPMLVIGQPARRCRSSGVIDSFAQMPPGRNSEACCLTSSAMAPKAAASIFSTSDEPATSPLMRSMSTAARFALAVSFGSRSQATISCRLPFMMVFGEAAASLKKARTAGHSSGSTSRMCSSVPMLRSITQSAESQMSAMARTAHMISSDPKPVRMELRSLPPASAPMSASSSRNVRRLPSCAKRSVTAASMKNT